VYRLVPFGSTEEIALTVDVVARGIAKPTVQGHLPNVRDCFLFIKKCQARRLNPWKGDCFLIGFDTKNGPVFETVVSHAAILERACADQGYDGMESGIIIAKQDGDELAIEGDFYRGPGAIVGGWAKVYHKNRRVPTYRRLDIDKYRKKSPLWDANPGMMIVKCAEADALRSSFPAIIGDMFVKEEMTSVAPRYEPSPAPPRKLLNEADLADARGTPPDDSPAMDDIPTAAAAPAPAESVADVKGILWNKISQALPGELQALADRVTWSLSKKFIDDTTACDMHESIKCRLEQLQT
jgi:phage recombination protein Bet